MVIATHESNKKHQLERYNLQTQSNENLQKECNQLRDRIQTLFKNVSKFEVLVESLNTRNGELKIEFDGVKSENRQLRAESDGLKANESRLLAENRALVVERNRHMEVARDTQRIMEEAERTSRDEKQRLDDRIERLDRELYFLLI